jgi:hypothetical protein
MFKSNQNSRYNGWKEEEKSYSLYVLEVEEDGELGWAGRPSWVESAQLGRFPFFVAFFLFLFSFLSFASKVI